MSDDEQQHSGGEDNEQEGSRMTLQVDKKAEQGFVSAYKALPVKPANTVRLFERDRGEFYTAHDDDAHFVATTIFKTTTVIKHLGGKKKKEKKEKKEERRKKKERRSRKRST